MEKFVIIIENEDFNEHREVLGTFNSKEEAKNYLAVIADEDTEELNERLIDEDTYEIGSYSYRIAKTTNPYCALFKVGMRVKAKDAFVKDVVGCLDGTIAEIRDSGACTVAFDAKPNSTFVFTASEMLRMFNIINN